MAIKAWSVGLLLPCLALGAEDAPGWLKDLAGIKLPDYGSKVGSVTLLNEEHTTVGDGGRLSTITRTAVKILSRKGGEITFFEQYDATSGKVRDFRAWIVSPSGKVKRYGKDEILDAACAANDVYNECRRRLVSCKQDAEAGAVFGYEAVVERQLFSPQVMFHFQDSSPVRLARLAVTVPSGWEVKSASFNGAPAESPPSGGTYAWQMENLPPVEREPHSPSLATIVPWVGVNLLGAGTPHVVSWAEAARFLAELNENQADPDEALAARAKALTEGAQTEMDKIRAIGRFTQQLNYVSVQVDVAKGGGYRPHPAAQVFQKLYGDCKDKANLTRAMLKAIGVTAYPVAIYSGDRTHVIPEWPSLSAFNHAISAIRVGPETRTPAVLEHPVLGRLLFFDPTDPYVPVGYLPDHEQGSLALVGAPESRDLVRVPTAHAGGTRLRQVKAVLKPNGAISGSFVERITGESFAESVWAVRAHSKEDYTRMLERWVGLSIPGASASGIEVTDRDGELVEQGEFTSARFAQLPQQRMMIFRAALLHHGDALRLTEKTRKYPVVMDADALDETVRIQLPEGYKIDEVPDAVHVASPFGQYEAKWEGSGGSLVFTRKIELEAQSVPAGQYPDLRRFLDTVYGSAETPVVLVK